MTVFISYSSQDVDFAIRLYTAFSQVGIPAWMDKFDIKPGQHWGRAIHTALRKSTHMVLVHTQSSFDSDQVWGEWQSFVSRQKPVIPLIVENVELPYLLESYQFVDFTTHFASAFMILVGSIDDPRLPPGKGGKMLPLRERSTTNQKQLPTQRRSSKVIPIEDALTDHAIVFAGDQPPADNVNAALQFEGAFSDDMTFKVAGSMRIYDEIIRGMLDTDEDKNHDHVQSEHVARAKQSEFFLRLLPLRDLQKQGLGIVYYVRTNDRTVDDWWHDPSPSKAQQESKDTIVLARSKVQRVHTDRYTHANHHQ